MCNDIFEAIKKGNLDAVKRFIEDEGMDIHERNDDGDTVAHVAAKNFDLEILEYLVKKEPSFLSTRGQQDLTLMEIAIGVKSMAMVQFLVDDCEVDILGQYNSKEHSGNYVHLTAEVCALQIFKYFIEEKRVDVNIQDTWGQPLVFSAARGICLNVVKYIVEECKGEVTGNDKLGRNIFCQSAVGCDLTVPKYLLDERKLPIDTNNPLIVQDALVWAQKFKSNKIAEFVRYFVEEKRMNLDSGWNGFPLHQAAEVGAIDMVKYLAQHGANIGRKNLQGKTPLEVATDEAVIKYLKEMECGRSRRSLPTPSKYDVNLWVRKTEAGISGALSLLDHRSQNADRKKLAYASSSNDIYNILALFSTFIMSRSHPRRAHWLPSPQDTIQNRIDPVAVEAIHQYLPRE